jgi:hypothetical protein
MNVVRNEAHPEMSVPLGTLLHPSHLRQPRPPPAQVPTDVMESPRNFSIIPGKQCGQLVEFGHVHTAA